MIVDLEYRGMKIFRDGEFFASTECGACRRLIEEDARPGISSIARFWRAGKPAHDLEMNIHLGAKYYVAEGRSGPVFKKFNPARFDKLRSYAKP